MLVFFVNERLTKFQKRHKVFLCKLLPALDYSHTLDCKKVLLKKMVLLIGFNIATNNFQRIPLFQVNNNNTSNFGTFTFIFLLKVVVAGMWFLIFILPKEQVSHEKKQSHEERKSLTVKENLSRGRKKSHGERKYLMEKEREYVSRRKKISHVKTRKKLKTIVIN